MRNWIFFIAHSTCRAHFDRTWSFQKREADARETRSFPDLVNDRFMMTQSCRVLPNLIASGVNINEQQDVKWPRIASSEGSLAIIRRKRSASIRDGSANIKYGLYCCVVRCCSSWVIFAGFLKLVTCNILYELFAQTFLHKTLPMNYHPTYLCKVSSSVPRIEWDQQYLSASRTSLGSAGQGKLLYRLPPERGKWEMKSFINILISPWKSWALPHIWQHAVY